VCMHSCGRSSRPVGTFRRTRRRRS
jgi:hypothetical protein